MGTQENKARRTTTHISHIAKLRRKQMRRIQKLVDKLKAKKIEWKPNMERRLKYEIRYMQKKLRELKVK